MTARGIELQIKRCERMMAPLQLVWEEVGSLDELLAKTLRKYQVELGARRATGETTVAWGPIRRTFAVEAVLLGLVAERQVRYALEVPSIATRLEANIDLIPFGEAETKLDYHAALEVQHPVASHKRRLLSEMAEEHALGIVTRIKAKSEHRRLAEERLLS
jgi:carbon monoxide dehydrogenase subunit G